MSLFEGCADVLSVTDVAAAPLNRAASGLSLEAQDPSTSLRNLRALFAAPTTDDEPPQRAQKRRKLDNTNAASMHAENSEKDGNMVLAKVSLQLVSGYQPFATVASDLEQNLHASSAEHPHVDAPLAETNALTVSLESFHKTKPNAFRAIVYNPETATALPSLPLSVRGFSSR
jgi:hypothetical protein